MRKEIEALKNLIAAMDAEEKARHEKETASDRARWQPVTLDENGNAVLSPSHSRAIENWAKAFSHLCDVRGTAKYLISCAEAAPREDENGPAARLPT